MSRVTQIPDARWGSPDTALSRLGAKFAATKPGSWTVRTLMPLDRRLLVRSNGRRTMLGPIGAPVMLLETTGRRTGRQRGQEDGQRPGHPALREL